MNVIVMSRRRIKTSRSVLIGLVAAFGVLFSTSIAASASPPIKLIPTGHITGGLIKPESVAVDPLNGDVLVNDKGNNRIQEFTAAGQFVLMFGHEVNTNGGNVCKAGETCKEGVEGSGAGAFDEAYAITADTAGDIYVQESSNARIQEFSSSGAFILMFGKEVNVNGGNICTAAEEANCRAGVQGGSVVEEYGFKFVPFAENSIAADDSSNTVYVGNEHDIKEFDSSGKYLGDIVPASTQAAEGNAVAVSVGKAGEIFALYNTEPRVIREFDSTKKEVVSGGFPLTLSPRHAHLESGFEIGAETLAFSPEESIAVTEFERGSAPGGEVRTARGWLYATSSGSQLTEFSTPAVPVPSNAIAFGSNGDMYLVYENEIIVYTPLSVGELVTDDPTCAPGQDIGTNATVNCDLKGTVNPEGIGGTAVWFEWGNTESLGNVTPPQSVTGNTPQVAEAPIEGSAPNSPLDNRFVGEDEHAKAPELLAGKEVETNTTAVLPRVLLEPAVLFVNSSSAVLYDEVNPENAASEYFFEYGEPTKLAACPGVHQASCPGVGITEVKQSSKYAPVPLTLEAEHLEAGKIYAYRLTVKNLAGETHSQTLLFETLPLPVPAVETGSSSSGGSTSQMISGLVNPGGQPTTYGFEVGLYAGQSTQFSIVSSGSAGSGSSPVLETYTLSGLQPGTEYAYRIVASNAYGTELGQPGRFQTPAVPAVLEQPAPPTLLAIPTTKFPATSPPVGGKPKKVTKCKRGYVRNKHGKCVKAKARSKAKSKKTKGPRR